jgi:hypothetical protein
MVSRENKIILLFGTAGLGLTYGGYALTDLGDQVLVAVLLFVGVLAPQLLNEYLDRRESG